MLSDQDSCKGPSEKPGAKPEVDRPLIYQIRIRSHLDPAWSDWFEGMTVTPEEDGDTLLSGLVLDQAALHGLLKKVRDLGMSLVSVNPVGDNPVDPSEEKFK